MPLDQVEGATETKLYLPISGMTCAACARRVEKALGAVSGVERAIVNLATQRATVEAVPGAVTAQALTEAVIRAGYGVPAETSGPGEAGATAKREPEPDDDLREIRRDLMAAVALTIPLFVLAMSHGRIEGADTLAGRLAQLFLATPVVFGPGRRFLRMAWRSLRHRSSDMNTLLTLGILASWGYSTVAVLAPGLFPHAEHGVRPHLYFEAAAGIITFVLFGKLLESRARKRLADAVRGLVALIPATAYRLRTDGSGESRWNGWIGELSGDVHHRLDFRRFRVEHPLCERSNLGVLAVHEGMMRHLDGHLMMLDEEVDECAFCLRGERDSTISDGRSIGGSRCTRGARPMRSHRRRIGGPRQVVSTAILVTTRGRAKRRQEPEELPACTSSSSVRLKIKRCFHGLPPRCFLAPARSLFGERAPMGVAGFVRVTRFTRRLLAGSVISVRMTFHRRAIGHRVGALTLLLFLLLLLLLPLLRLDRLVFGHRVLAAYGRRWRLRAGGFRLRLTGAACDSKQRAQQDAPDP